MSLLYRFRTVFLVKPFDWNQYQYLAEFNGIRSNVDDILLYSETLSERLNAYATLLDSLKQLM